MQFLLNWNLTLVWICISHLYNLIETDSIRFDPTWPDTTSILTSLDSIRPYSIRSNPIRSDTISSTSVNSTRSDSTIHGTTIVSFSFSLSHTHIHAYIYTVSFILTPHSSILSLFLSSALFVSFTLLAGSPLCT